MKINDFLCKPSLMCENFLQPLNLKFKEIEEITKNVREKEALHVYSPKTLVATCAYTFLRQENEKKESTNKDVSISHVAKVLGVSSMAMYRCYKNIK